MSSEHLREFSKKIRNSPNGINRGVWGKLIYVENLKSKILWHCPFNYTGTGTKPSSLTLVMVGLEAPHLLTLVVEELMDPAILT